MIERTQKALAQAPPVAFDVARQAGAFHPYIQYVEIRLRGCAIQRHRIVNTQVPCREWPRARCSPHGSEQPLS